MADHVNKTVEVKVLVTSLITLVASTAAAILNGVQANPDLLGTLPPVWQFLLITAIPPVLAFLAGYAQPSNRA